MSLYPSDYYVEGLLKLPVRVYLAATGAGAGLQQLLWNVPGISAVLAGAEFPYARDRTNALLGFTPESYCNESMALDLALAAYLRADDGSTTPVGLGLTAAVASISPHRGHHRIHAAVVTQQGVWASDLLLPKGGAERRVIDGQCADSLGFELLMYAVGLLTYEDIDKNKPMNYGGRPYDASEQARKRFLEFPVVTKEGVRHSAPEGEAVLFPGNFFPPHEGHFANSTADTIFQITANPPHKPELTLQDMLERARHFRHRGDVLFLDGCGLYIEKARRFPGSTLILGTDALRRMLDPKWGYDPETLLEAFKEVNTTFLVSCRGDDSLEQIDMPEWARTLFTALPKTPYSNLSSTQIRMAANG